MLRFSLLVLSGVVLFAANADASTYHHRYHRHQFHARVAPTGHRAYSEARFARGGGEIVAHPADCPRTLFCGCGAAHELGLADRSLWLVRSWYKFPRTAAAPGMAALWGARHVAVIRAVNGDGTATVYDANSGGGLTRVHRVSLAGLTIVDPHGGGARALAAGAEMPRGRADRAVRLAYRHRSPARYQVASDWNDYARGRHAYQPPLAPDLSQVARAQMMVSFVR